MRSLNRAFLKTPNTLCQPAYLAKAAISNLLAVDREDAFLAEAGYYA